MPRVTLLLLLLCQLSLCRLIPICDPLIDGFAKGSCVRVSVINDPRGQEDMSHCVCSYIIREQDLYRSRLYGCAFAELSDGIANWEHNDCEERSLSPSMDPIIQRLPQDPIYINTLVQYSEEKDEPCFACN
jgi:hypothetical protein